MSNLIQKQGTPLNQGQKDVEFWAAVGQKFGELWRAKFPPKPGAVHFFGQPGRKSTKGSGHFFNVDPALAQKLLDENHRQRQDLANEVNRLFKGE